MNEATVITHVEAARDRYNEDEYAAMLAQAQEAQS